MRGSVSVHKDAVDLILFEFGVQLVN